MPVRGDGDRPADFSGLSEVGLLGDPLSFPGLLGFIPTRIAVVLQGFPDQVLGTF